MENITAEKIQTQAAIIALHTGKSLVVDNAPMYGGWQIMEKNTTSGAESDILPFCTRLPAKAFWYVLRTYIAGMQDGATLERKKETL